MLNCFEPVFVLNQTHLRFSLAKWFDFVYMHTSRAEARLMTFTFIDVQLNHLKPLCAETHVFLFPNETCTVQSIQQCIRTLACYGAGTTNPYICYLEEKNTHTQNLF